MDASPDASLIKMDKRSISAMATILACSVNEHKSAVSFAIIKKMMEENSREADHDVWIHELTELIEHSTRGILKQSHLSRRIAANLVHVVEDFLRMLGFEENGVTAGKQIIFGQAAGFVGAEVDSGMLLKLGDMT